MAVQPLIREDIEGQVFRVHRSAMTSPDVLKLERQRIFDRCWLYVGHESEVPNAGDYRRRKVGGRPLFFVRASDGNVRVFYNTCRHRGAMICRHDQGNGEIFQCFYHAWTFNSRGELIGVPDEEGYAEGFNKADLSLLSPPNVDSYRGFIFICYDPHAMDLRSYLAGATEFIDLVADQSEAGMRVIRGSNRYSIQANWKLLVENSFDNYHVGPTHKTYIDYQTSLGVKILPQSERWSAAYSLGNGHAVMEFAATAGSVPQPGGHPFLARTPRRRSRHCALAWWSVMEKSAPCAWQTVVATCSSSPTCISSMWPALPCAPSGPSPTMKLIYKRGRWSPEMKTAGCCAPASTVSSPSSAPAASPRPTIPRP